MPEREVLLAYYGHLRDEITRYRNFEWQITAYVAALFVFLIGLTGPDHPIDTKSGWPIKMLWTVLFVGVAAFGEFALTYVHRSLNRRRDDAVRLEILLGLYRPFQPDQHAVDLGLFTAKDLQPVIARSPRRYQGFNEGPGIFFVLAFLVFVLISCTACSLHLWLR